MVTTNKKDEVVMKIFLIAVSIISCLVCSACTRQDMGMVSGGVLGGAAGSALTHGSPAGAVVGAVGGAYVGRQLAQ